MAWALTSDLAVKVAISVIAIAGPPTAWYYGGKQQLKAKIDRDKSDGANAAKTADAAQQTADAAKQTADAVLMNSFRQAGVDSLKTLLDGATAISELSRKVQEQGEELGRLKYDNAVKFGELQLAHVREINDLQSKITSLDTQVKRLRAQIARKDEQLADCAKVKERASVLERDLVGLRAELDEQKLANSAFLLLWQSAAENKGDPAQVNLAEQAINRILQRSERAAVMVAETPPGSRETVDTVVTAISIRHEELDDPQASDKDEEEEPEP